MDGNTDWGEQLKVGAIEVPSLRETDKIDLAELIARQKEQFKDHIIEAEQGTEETWYVLEKNILYNVAEPNPRAGIYPKLILPQQYRKQVIERPWRGWSFSGGKES